MKSLKHKLGPLPLWAWVLIAGGTIGLVWYLRSGRSSSAPPAPSDGTTGPVLDATAGAPPDASGGGGGGSPIPLPPLAPGGASLDDVYSQLLNLDADVATIAGGQGLTDAANGADNTPTQNFQGQATDFLAAVKTIQDIQAQLAPKTAAKKPAKKTAAKKRTTHGSGDAGKTTKHTKHAPARRTTQHVAAKNPKKPKVPAARHGHAGPAPGPGVPNAPFHALHAPAKAKHTSGRVHRTTPAKRR